MNYAIDRVGKKLKTSLTRLANKSLKLSFEPYYLKLKHIFHYCILFKGYNPCYAGKD